MRTCRAVLAVPIMLTRLPFTLGQEVTKLLSGKYLQGSRLCRRYNAAMAHEAAAFLSAAGVQHTSARHVCLGSKRRLCKRADRRRKRASHICS